jgi:ABC-type multidrug transport system ATPase subunit
LFDKVLVLHEGHQIFFGPTRNAKQYFSDIGFIPPARSTTPEFLTSVTRPVELRPNKRENTEFVPRSALEFAQMWKSSSDRETLMSEIQTYERSYPIGDVNCLRTMRKMLGNGEKKQ